MTICSGLSSECCSAPSAIPNSIVRRRALLRVLPPDAAQAYAAGCTIVAASGHGGGAPIAVPAGDEEVISVGGVGANGLRCVGGEIRRVYTASAVGGTASVPRPGDPSITEWALALGDGLLPGSTRFHQVLYRDPSSSFCPPPLGSS